MYKMKDTEEEKLEKNTNIDKQDEIVEQVEIEKQNEVQENKTEQTSEKKKKEKNVVSKILSGIWKTLGVLIVILCIAIIIRALVFKKYDVFGYRFYLIMSGSMEPTIHVGDAIITKENKNIETGDVIAFQYGNSVTVHRVIKTYNEGNKKLYQTKGDNNNTEDKGLRTTEDIKGEVLFKIPRVGDLVLFLQRNIVIIVILLVGIMLVISLVRRLL